MLGALGQELQGAGSGLLLGQDVVPVLPFQLLTGMQGLCWAAQRLRSSLPASGGCRMLLWIEVFPPLSLSPVGCGVPPMLFEGSHIKGTSACVEFDSG